MYMYMVQVEYYVYVCCNWVSVMHNTEFSLEGDGVSEVHTCTCAFTVEMGLDMYNSDNTNSSGLQNLTLLITLSVCFA